jgi:glycosyltransferase involved in cell wall biosynthesis
MSSKIPVSVYIICQDEAQHIRRVLESVKMFDEIVIVDSGSQDDTLRIAGEYTDKIYHQKWLGYARQKEYAKHLCTHEWVLNLDADEQLSETLLTEIRQTISNQEVDGLDIAISSRYLGQFNHPWSKFNRRVRFFRKAKGHYPEKLVHESIVIDGNVKKARGLIYDYGIVDLKTHLAKINQYSSLRAEEKAQKGKRASVIKLLMVFPLSFFKSFVLKRGFLNGMRGWIAAMNNAYYAFLKEAKLYEQNKKDDA